MMRDFTAGYLIKALREIRENPNGHNYPADEVEEILKIEEEFRRDYEEYSRSPVVREANRLHLEMQKQRLEWPKQNHALFSNMRHITSLGWYVSPVLIRDIPMLEAAELFRKENVLKFQEKIIELADEAIPRILTKCGKQFPERKIILEEIREAFKVGLYSAVVSLSYSQADGISNDVWGFGFFDKNKREEYKLKSYLNLKGGEIGINTGVAEQLGMPSNEIIVHEGDELLKDPDYRKKSFNRHLVIHGHSTDYGTRLNAIRAIYLLDLISYFNKPAGESVYE